MTDSPTEEDEEVARAIAAAQSVSKLHLTTQAVKSITTDDHQRELVEKHIAAASEREAETLQSYLQWLPLADLGTVSTNVDFLKSEETKESRNLHIENETRGLGAFHTSSVVTQHQQQSDPNSSEGRVPQIVRSTEAGSRAIEECALGANSIESPSLVAVSSTSTQSQQDQEIAKLRHDLQSLHAKVRILSDAIISSKEILHEAHFNFCTLELSLLALCFVVKLAYLNSDDMILFSATVVIVVVLWSTWRKMSWRKSVHRHEDIVKRVAAEKAALRLDHRTDLSEVGSTDMSAECSTGSIDEDLLEEEVVSKNLTDDDKKKMKEASHLAHRLYQDEQLFAAARVLRSLDPGTLSTTQQFILSKDAQCEELLDVMLSKPSNGWREAGDSGGTRLDYKLDGESQTVLTSRVETPIDRSLVLPFISVLNETELLHTFLPNWKYPKWGIRPAVKLAQRGRCYQVLILTLDLPWPFAPREVALRAFAVDDIDTNCHIFVKTESLHTGDENGLIPPPAEASAERIDVNGGFLFRPHSTNGEESDQIMVTFCSSMDLKIPVLPQWFIDFLVGTVMATSWQMLLKVVKDVKDGKSAMHTAAIRKKRGTVYDWVETRVDEMLAMGAKGSRMNFST